MCCSVIRGCGHVGASVGCFEDQALVMGHHVDHPDNFITPVTCYCDTDKCNGAVMKVSFGHLSMAIALINVIIGYLL